MAKLNLNQLVKKNVALTIENIFMIFKYTHYNHVIFMHNEQKITDMQTLESNTKTTEESTNPISLNLPDFTTCLLYTSPSPRDGLLSRMPSSA